MTVQQFEMKMDLNILKHLGLNLYSNVPAALSEAVANAWDADAHRVDVKIHGSETTCIEIQDYGRGMTREELNDKYLLVGYDRRKAGEGVTEGGRKVMGRKGIGKLSLLSIARTVEVHTARNGQKNALRLNLDDIMAAIEKRCTYYPVEITCRGDLAHGTLVIIKDLKKRLRGTDQYLRKRIARRFGILGQRYNFQVFINGSEILPSDRGYQDKVQFLWAYNMSDSEKYVFRNVRQTISRDGTINSDCDYSIKGWIGAVEKSGQLKDDEEGLNKIVILTRGKVAQEDILSDLGETGLFSKYLVGEIEADFLDRDDKDDIATSSRQAFIQDDERFLALRSFLVSEIKYIQNQWTELRNEVDSAKALESEAIKDWYETLDSTDLKKKAKSLLGKIGRLTTEDNAARMQLTANSILAFESLKVKGHLDALDTIGSSDLVTLSKIVYAFDDVESTLYHQIVSGRLKIIEDLATKVDTNALERVLQKHLFDHLWLLDPSWERATSTPRMEENVKKAFSAIDTDLSPEEKSGRVDIRYRKTSGTHIIIELKRASIVADVYRLGCQVRKYTDALKKCLVASGERDPDIQAIIVTGQWPRGWDDASVRDTDEAILKAQNARLILYEQLLRQSQEQYLEYIESHKKASRIRAILDRVATEFSLTKE